MPESDVPDESENPFADAIALANDGRWDEAVRDITRTLPDESIDVRLEVLLTEIPSSSALRYADDLVQAQPERSFGHMFRAAVLQVEGRTFPALEEARTAKTLDPHSRDALYLIACSAPLVGAPMEGFEAAERLVEHHPDWAISHFLLARHFTYQEKWKEARAAAERDVNLGRNRGECWDTLGTILVNSSELLGAIRCFWLASKLNPYDEETRQHLASTLVTYENQTARRRLPIAILFFVVAGIGYLALSRALLMRIGVSPATAVLASIPPIVLLLPIGAFLFRRFALKDLEPEIREFAESERRRQRLRSGSVLAFRHFLIVLLVASYYVAFAIWYYPLAKKDLPLILGFYLFVGVLGWLRSRRKPEQWPSLKDR